MVTIRDMLVTGSARFVGAGTNTRQYLMIHTTGNRNKGADADAHGRLQQRGNDRAASWQLTVDDKEAVRSYLDTEIAWHAGSIPWSRKSIAIEICVNSDGNYLKALQNAAELAALVMKANDIPIIRVVQHNTATGKNCPEEIRANKYDVSWSKFLTMISTELDKLNGAVTHTPPTVEPKPPAVSPSPAPKEYPQAPLLVDGDWAAATTTAWQLVLPKKYNNGVNLVADGYFGPVSIKATQRWLNSLGYYFGAIDGVWGTLSKKALQSFLWDKGLYRNGGFPKAVMVDGKFETRSIKAWQTYLNTQRQYLL